MARPPRLHYDGAIYHVIARGNERRLIFREDADRQDYLDQLALASRRTGARVFAYCLLSNHLHLALQAAEAPLAEVIGPLHSKYARDFNKKYRRTGHLFEARYRAILIDEDSYLLSVVRYIHLNPVNARLVSSPETYNWSSHRDYLGSPPRWLTTANVLDFFRPRPNPRRLFHEFVVGHSSHEAPAYAPAESSLDALVGDHAFTREALRKAQHEELFLRTITLQQIVALASVHEKVSVASLRGPSRVRSLSALRATCAVVARDLARIPVAETARYFNRDQSTLSRDVKHLLENATSQDRKRLARLRKAVERIGTSGRESK